MQIRNFTTFIVATVLAIALGFLTNNPLRAGEAKADELATLRHAYAALHAADHDYNGHRHKAMEAIRAACKLLGSAPEGDGIGHEPQRESDAHLKRAQELLSSITPSSKYVAKHIKHAMEELSVALSIK